MRITSPNWADESEFSHGFFTREGGVSEGIYASLNCGTGSQDDADAVRENIRRCLVSLGNNDAAFCKLWQIHSADVITVREPWDIKDSPKADAMVTDQPNIVLGILTADCGPVLFADRQAGVVGAAHAGWKGAFGGVLENTIAAMEALGAEREHIEAVLGPCIAQASYEVGPEFYARFAEENALYGTFFMPSQTPEHFLFDLGGFVRHRLLSHGLQNVQLLAMDTYENEAQFFSYRRTTHRGQPDYGRQLSAIMLRD